MGFMRMYFDPTDHITTMGKCGDRNCEVMAENYECEFPMDVMSTMMNGPMERSDAEDRYFDKMSNVFSIYEECLQNSTMLLVKDFCKKSCNTSSMFYQFLLKHCFKFYSAVIV